jgi:hypothetical protein
MRFALSTYELQSVGDTTLMQAPGCAAQFFR